MRSPRGKSAIAAKHDLKLTKEKVFFVNLKPWLYLICYSLLVTRYLSEAVLVVVR
jgi:hypothetical protein